MSALKRYCSWTYILLTVQPYEKNNFYENPVSWHKLTNKIREASTRIKRSFTLLTYTLYVDRLARLLNEFKTFPRYWLEQISRRLPYWNLIPQTTDEIFMKERQSYEIFANTKHSVVTSLEFTTRGLQTVYCSRLFSTSFVCCVILWKT